MKEVEILLTHILENITAIQSYIKGKTKKDFIKNIQLQDSIIRRLEITGEAAKNLPPLFRKTYLQIPWDRISGMRDILIHEYFGVDLNLVWDTVKKDIPFLKKEIQEILTKLSKE